jgi:hypothetical protein
MWLTKHAIDAKFGKRDVGAELEKDMCEHLLLLNQTLLNQVQNAFVEEIPNLAEMSSYDACTLSSEGSSKGNGTKQRK